MASSVTNLAFQRAVLDAQTVSSAIFDGAVLHLTKALVVPSPTSVLADFTAHEVDFSGYATVAQTWTPSHTLPAGGVRAPGVLSEYSLNALTTTNTAYNAYLSDAGATTLLGAAVLPSAVPLTTLDQGLSIVPFIPWGVLAQQVGIGIDLIVPATQRRLGLNALTGMTGLLHNAKAHLFASNISITSATTLTTLAAAEATYTGYAAQTISTWLAAVVDALGQAKVSGAEQRWAPSGSGTANTIYGVYITDSTSATLFWAYNLDSPVTLNGVDTGFYDSPTLTWGT